MVGNYFLELMPHKIAYAHCDIPCGIYDPNNLQMAAHTIYRMTELLKSEKDMHKISRLTRIKEKHSDIFEEEVSTLADDYFKEDHYKKYKELETIFDEAIKLSTLARQNIDLKSATSLIETTHSIAEIFYDSKKVGYKKVKSVYPTGLEVVVQE